MPAGRADAYNLLGEAGIDLYLSDSVGSSVPSSKIPSSSAREAHSSQYDFCCWIDSFGNMIQP